MTKYGTNSSSNPRHGSDEYFNFLDMGGPTRDYSGGRLEPGINDPGRAQQGYQSAPAYNDGQVHDFHSKQYFFQN